MGMTENTRSGRWTGGARAKEKLRVEQARQRGGTDPAGASLDERAAGKILEEGLRVDHVSSRSMAVPAMAFKHGRDAHATDLFLGDRLIHVQDDAGCRGVGGELARIEVRIARRF